MHENQKEVDEMYKIILDYYEAFAHLLEVGTEGEKRFAIEAFNGVQRLIAARLEKITGEKKENFLKLRAFLQQDTSGLGEWMKETEKNIQELKKKIEPEIKKTIDKKTRNKKVRRGRMEKNIRSKFS
jgi:hypothetical protein